MKRIFEMETEVTRCDYEPDASAGFRYAGPDYATLFAQTEAFLIGKKLLKIEQHCSLRHDEELPEQPWIKPRVTLEPAIESEDEMVALARRLHEEFVQCSRQQVPTQFVA